MPTVLHLSIYVVCLFIELLSRTCVLQVLRKGLIQMMLCNKQGEVLENTIHHKRGILGIQKSYIRYKKKAKRFGDMIFRNDGQFRVKSDFVMYR